MASGLLKLISEIEVGDRVIGVERIPGKFHWPYRYVEATVLATVQTIKPAFRIITEDTFVDNSGDHRWLSDRGWKYTQGSMGGALQRPYLTTNNSIRALGPSFIAPGHSIDYKRGYLSGLIKGDATLRRYDYSGRYT